ncbi:MAG: D-alanyl-D-alanine carboxypeptidase family protein [Armatimonadota bacterium]|nr:D-alanyl-D-alanine carboxypeptidase [Armatimonadota bacterium]MDW8025060.1 D-alanyl-D-alanine carboxypeptidase family protein [Armatimonadota bacterium]
MKLVGSCKCAFALHIALSLVAVNAFGLEPDQGDKKHRSKVGCFEPPRLTAKSALLVDVRTGTILYELNPTGHSYPASLTKLMTALLIVEHGNLDDAVTVPKEATLVGESSANLKEDEVVTLRQLLYLVLVRSANDACVAAAIHIAGSVDAFVKMMNERAIELGAQDTNFCNPHGLHHKDHRTTALDLWRITSAALGYGEIRRAVSTRFFEMPPTNKSGARVFRNRNRLLWEYDGADGVKTGYTIPAGRCLIATATRSDWQLMAIVLKSEDAFKDAAALLDFGFSTFVCLPIAIAGRAVANFAVHGGVPSCVPAAPKRSFYTVVRKDELSRVSWRVHQKAFEPPISKGDVIGYIEVVSPRASRHLIELISECDVKPSTAVILRRIAVRASLIAFALLCIAALLRGLGLIRSGILPRKLIG